MPLKKPTVKDKKNTIINKLKANSSAEAVAGMARFGINPKNTFGVSIPTLRKIAKETGKDHKLAIALWRSGIHEARILASMVDEPSEVDNEQMENWVREFDSWDLCDQCCLNLLKWTKPAYKKCREWSERDEEFIKRASFALMACLAVGDKRADDKKFHQFFSIIKRESKDERNYVKKAVNWALRQIGKRSFGLNKLALEVADEISLIDSKAARWVAADALRELRQHTNRLKKMQKKGLL